ncbi:RidA family protein [Cohnella sp. GbtcB17]|uniref:RidA family protein n=1 Tax=Cohnella sp. GbtcB17 TaxID=2824762 RepID=UPI001C30B4CA|nr:RidA family protein [Cohnella sp. GbtcB17]
MRTEIKVGPSSNRPFSAGIQTESMVFVSGSGGLNLETGKIVGDDLESQTVQTMANIEEVLKASGLTFNDVVKANIYLSDRKLYDEFNEIYRRYFSPPYPSRTAIYCDLNFGLLVEIDVIAVRRNGNSTLTTR